MHALELVEHLVDSPEDKNSPPKMPKPVRVPDALKKRAPNVQGWRLGMVEILAEPGPSGWHLSVSHPKRFPHVQELMLARGITGDVDKTFAAVIPAALAPPREHPRADGAHTSWISSKRRAGARKGLSGDGRQSDLVRP